MTHRRDRGAIVIGDGITFTPARPVAPRRRAASRRSKRVVASTIERPTPAADPVLIADLEAAAPASQALAAFAGTDPATLRDGHRRAVRASGAEPRTVIEAMLAAGADLGDVFASTSGSMSVRTVGVILRDEFWYSPRDVRRGARDAGFSDDAASVAAGMDVRDS